MNISRDGISTHAIKSYALQITVALLAVSSVVAFVCGFILKPLFPNDYIMLMIVSITVSLSITSYFFMKKALGAFAVDVARKGITEELNNSQPNK